MRLAALGSTVQRAAAPGYASSRSANAVRRRLVAGALVAVSLVLITGYFRESESGTLHDIQGATASALHPFQVGAERVARPFEDAYGWLAGFVHAKSENEKLKEQLRLLEQQATQNITAARENLKLRQALDYRSGPTFPRGYRDVAAQVTNHRLSEFQEKIVVAAGRNDGVRIDDPVVDSYGQRAGESLILDLVPKDKLVKETDLIVTAGRRGGELPSLYPKGLGIGTVTGVGRNDIDVYQSIQIDPLADFSSLG